MKRQWLFVAVLLIVAFGFIAYGSAIDRGWPVGVGYAVVVFGGIWSGSRGGAA